jgi:hypothetical protein
MLLLEAVDMDIKVIKALEMEVELVMAVKDFKVKMVAELALKDFKDGKDMEIKVFKDRRGYKVYRVIEDQLDHKDFKEME